SAGGVARSGALIAGAILVRLLQGVVIGYMFSASAAAGTSSGGEPSPVTSTLLLVVGLMFAIMGIKAYRDEPDPDAPPPKWMTTLNSLTPVKAFLIGAAWVLLGMKLWAFTLSAVSTIREAN